MALTIYQGKQKIVCKFGLVPRIVISPLQLGEGLFYAQWSKDEKKQSNKGGNSMKMKETLQIGKTEFPMRGNLPTKEVDYQKEWEEADVYGQRQKKNEANQHSCFTMAHHMPMVRFTWDMP